MPQFCRQWSIKGILDALQAFLIKDAQVKQQYATSCFRGDMRKRAAKRENLQGLPFTVYQAKRLFKCPLSTASRLLRRLATKGWYNRTHIKPKEFALDDCPGSPHAIAAYVALRGDAGVFAYRGKLYKAEPSRIDWLPEVCMVGSKGNPNNM